MTCPCGSPVEYRVLENVPSSRGTAVRYHRLCRRCADRQAQYQLLAGADRVEAESLMDDERALTWRAFQSTS